jgi:hypothetical protein
VASETTPTGRARITRFGRDLALNVLGNLATAAILYLVAVAGGYLKANPGLIGTAAAFLVLSAAFGLVGSFPFGSENDPDADPRAVRSARWTPAVFVAAIAVIALVVLYSTR